MVLKFVKNRLGDMIAFDSTRIKDALLKAYKVINISEDNVDVVTEKVVKALEVLHDDCDIIGLEHIQDVVEKELMKAGEYDVAKQYILYRQEHTEKREKLQKQIQDKFEHKANDRLSLLKMKALYP